MFGLTTNALIRLLTANLLRQDDIENLIKDVGEDEEEIKDIKDEADKTISKIGILLKSSVASMISETQKASDDVNTLKENLSGLYQLADSNNPFPFVIIVDELDRCRPDFALSVLERIKHLFSVKNVVFVLSMKKVQLEKSICHIYGNIDAAEYLQKFINCEITLPKKAILPEEFQKHKIIFLKSKAFTRKH